MTMDIEKRIIGYLMETYDPEALLLYGSFADGSANERSDFDALVIADHSKTHDTSTIGGTALDVFVYPPEAFLGEYDPEDFVQVYDGRIVLDRNGAAEGLLRRVRDYVAAQPKKTGEELHQALDWCEKMLSRTLRGDAEGWYRWHWLLTDSLEIYCDLRGLYYRGPKKALRQMEATDGEAFHVYIRALKEMDRERLAAWIGLLKGLCRR